MLVERSDGEPRGRLDVEIVRGLRSPGRGGVVAVLQVGARFVHRRKAGAEGRGRLRCLSGGLFLGAPFEELLQASIVLSRLGQQRGRVLLGQQAVLRGGTVSDSHECFSTQV